MKRKPLKLVAIILLGLGVFFSSFGFSTPLKMNYSGRLAAPTGQPVVGPIHLQIKFFDSQVAGSQLGLEKDFPEVSLREGLFDLILEFSEKELALIFKEGKETWLQVTDITHQVDYNRQMLTSMPYALRIPVDNKSLKFSDSSGKLEVHEFSQIKLKSNRAEVILAPSPAANGDTDYTLPAGDGTPGQVLSTNGNGQLQWANTEPSTNPLDSDADGVADAAATADLLNGKEASFYLDLDNKSSGTNNKLFTSAEKTKLSLLQTDSGVNAASVTSAGALMEANLPSSAGFLRTDANGNVVEDSTTYLTSESDPQIGDISVAGNWCTTDGAGANAVINCDQATPLMSSDLGEEADDVVQLDASGRLPSVDGSQLSSLDLSAPGPIGSSVANSATFTQATTDSLRLTDSGGDGATNHLSLQPPVSISDNSTVYTLPASPSNGLYLQTDGSGNMSWANPGLSLAADNFSSGTVSEGLIAAGVARVAENPLSEESDLTTALDDNYQAANAHLDDLADGSLSGSKVGTGISGSNITVNKVADARIDSQIARLSELTYRDDADETDLTDALDTEYQPSDGDLTDLADESLTGSKIGSGINGSHITANKVPDARIDATVARVSEIVYSETADLRSDLDSVYQEKNTHLDELAGGTLDAAKISTALSGSQFTTNKLAEARIDSEIARVSEITYPDKNSLNTALDSVYQAKDSNGHLADLADDGVLAGSRLSDLDGAKITTGTISEARVHGDIARLSEVPYQDVSDLRSDLDTVYQGADADLSDLADGSLTASKVGTEISASNVTGGSNLDQERLPADISRTNLTASGTVTAGKFRKTDCADSDNGSVVQIAEGGYVYGCMEVDTHGTSRSYTDAARICNNSGGRLPKAFEFQIAGKIDQTTDIISGRGDYQWMAEGFLAKKNTTYNARITIFRTEFITTKYKVRCFYPR